MAVGSVQPDKVLVGFGVGTADGTAVDGPAVGSKVSPDVVGVDEDGTEDGGELGPSVGVSVGASVGATDGEARHS